MAQAGGYLLAAPGPWLIGWISAAMGNWTLAYGMIALMAAGTAIFGYLSGRSGTLSLDNGEAG
jgi:MFS transporter, CP family, cyanate transporter